MTNENKQQTINKQLIADLNSKDVEIAKEAVKKMRSVGSAELIPSLINKWLNSDGELNHELTSLLYSLKDKKTILPLIDAMVNEKSSANREKIISIFWNANLEPKEHLAAFVRVAVKGEFMETLECLTVIENMDPPFPESELMDSMLVLKDYFSENQLAKGEKKFELLRSIATIIKISDDYQIEN